MLMISKLPLDSECALPNPPTKPRDVVQLLTKMVEADGLGVGDRLPPEVDLAERFGISRSKIREALRQWESLGVIARNKGAGTKLIAEISSNTMHLPLMLQIEAASLSRVLAVRRPLEIEATRIAARLATPAMRMEVMAKMEELMTVYEAGQDWRAADYQFHSAIHRATGNPLFGKVIDQIHRAFHGLYEAPFDQPQLGSDTIPMHRELALAIFNGDADRAGALIEKIMADVDLSAQDIAKGRI